MNVKNNILIGVMIVVCFILQCTVFSSLSFGGIRPNLLIIVTSVFGFMRGKKCGLLVGFFSGLLCDIFFNDVLCFYALIYMYIGFINGFFNRLFYREDIKLPLALITGSDLLFGLINYVLLFLLRSRFNFPFYTIHTIIPEVVYTVLVAMPLYPIILFINHNFDANKKRSAGKFVQKY